ncbi:hypothetical protein ACHAWO_006677 [Cyclotella atomus]|uniref:Rad60/SUMO-like domain-containing protein n=1 Tax=Cyclotella atomus TaxID=382360 RepID=A0ABD3QBG8_9STRA
MVDLNKLLDDIRQQSATAAAMQRPMRCVSPDPPDDDKIIIRVKDQSGEETRYLVWKYTKLSKVFAAYCIREGVDASTLMFRLYGADIDGNDTPAMLGMEDQDQIDAVRVNVPVKEVPLDEPPKDTILIMVRDQSRKALFVKVKKSTKLSEVFQAYRMRKGLDMDVGSTGLTLSLNGVNIDGNDTPHMLQLKYCSQIDAILEP